MMQKNKKVVIFGTGEIGSLAKFYFDRNSDYLVAGFTADDEFVTAQSIEGVPLVAFSHVKKFFPPEDFFMHVALSYRKLNQTRADKYAAAKALGYRLASYVCTRSVYWDDLDHGDNCFILENQTIQPGVRIGNNVMIWSGNHIGHAAVIEDHCYISSHVVISGHAVIGERSFLGVNSTIKDFVRIGKGSFVTMNACAAKDVPEGAVVLGASGKIYGPDTKHAQLFKKKYFT